MTHSTAAEVHYMIRRISDGRWLSWDGWSRSIWVTEHAGQYPEQSLAVREGKLEAPGDFEVLKQDGRPGLASEAPMEVVYSDQSSKPVEKFRKLDQEEIALRKAQSLPGHEWWCQLNVITTGERTMCTCSDGPPTDLVE